MPALFYDGDTSTYTVPLTDTLTIKFIYLEPPHFSFLRLLENEKKICEEGIPPKLAEKIENYCEKLNQPVSIEDFTNQLRDWDLNDFLSHLANTSTHTLR